MIKKRIVFLLILLSNSGAFAGVDFTHDKAIVGDLFIRDLFNRLEEGNGILNPPVLGSETMITPSFITNPNKRCWISPQYHGDGGVTPRLICN